MDLDRAQQVLGLECASGGMVLLSHWSFAAKRVEPARHDEDNGSARFRLQRPRMATYRLGDEDSSPAWTL